MARADGAWRLYAFADAGGDRLRALCAFLADAPASPLRRHTPAGTDPDSVIDLRAIFQQGHRSLRLQDLPPVLLPLHAHADLADFFGRILLPRH